MSRFISGQVPLAPTGAPDTLCYSLWKACAKKYHNIQNDNYTFREFGLLNRKINTVLIQQDWNHIAKRTFGYLCAIKKKQR